MAYSIAFTDQAKKRIKKLSPDVQRLILDYLEHDIAPLADAKTKGKPLAGKLGGFWRYRVGDYRIICKITDKMLTILVVKIGHRSDVYEER